jgi:hypothetical protein
MTVEIAGGITVGSNSLIVFGITISAYDALNGGVAVVATFDATAGVWRSYASNRQNSVQSLSPIPALSIVANNTNGTLAPTTLLSSINGQVPMRSSNTLIWSFLTQANLDSAFFGLNYEMTAISNSQVKSLFSTPVSLVSVRTSIAIPSLVLLEVVYGGAAFATENTLVVRYNGASNAVLKQVGGIATTSSNIFMFVPETGTISSSQVIKETDIELAALASNPTAGGTTTLKIHTFYIQASLS